MEDALYKLDPAKLDDMSAIIQLINDGIDDNKNERVKY